MNYGSSGLTLERRTEVHTAGTFIMNFSPGEEWWRLEGAGFKTIKSICYGLLGCFEIFERDTVWPLEGLAGTHSIYPVGRAP